MHDFLKIPLAAVVCLTAPAMAQEAGRQEQKGPLAFEVPEEWVMKYQGDGVDIYTLSGKGNSCTMVLSRWPAGGGREQIPAFIGQLAKGFVDRAKQNKALELMNPEALPEDLTGEEFSGSYVVFEMKGGGVQAMYMVGDGTDVWKGRFTGTMAQWDKALAVLKKLKRNG